MGYLGRIHHTGVRESFWTYYPRFFTGGGGNVSGFTGDLSPGHLWFVLFLFVLTLLALPIFAWIKSASGQRFAAGAAGLMSRPGGLLLVPLVLLVLNAVPEIAGRSISGFFFYLVAGFLWMSHPRFQESVDRQRYLLLTLCLGTAVLFIFFRRWGERQSGFSLGSAAFDLLSDTYAWTTVMALLGFGHVRLNRPGRAIKYLGPASYPFYIIHLPVVIAFAYFLVQANAGPALKFLAITGGSFAVTFLVYEFLVRRIPAVGRLMGMPPSRHSLQR
jgi:surface polysaccharide O-acyltransferase-like enzyme